MNTLEDRRWLALWAVLCAAVMDLLDATVMIVAGPSVQEAFGATDAVLLWLTAAYTLPFGVLLILGGRFGDRWGRRRIFLIGATGFVLASILCALSPSIEVLLAARVLQGAFGALLIPQGYGLVGTLFSRERERGRAFSMFGPVSAIAGVGGPILAGALIGWDMAGIGWRAIFLVNVPIGIFVIIAAAACLPRDDTLRSVRIDPVGAALVAAVAALIVFPLIEGPQSSWPWWSFALMAGSAVAGWTLTRQMRRSPAPILEPTLLGKPAFLAGLVLAIALFAGTGGLTLLLSLYLQLSNGDSALGTGLALAPLAVGIAIGSPISAKLRLRFGRRGLHVGLAVEILGLALLAIAIAVASGAIAFELAVFVIGIGQGLLFGPVIQTILGTADTHEIGSAAGAMTSLQQIATAFGIAVLGTIFFTATDATTMIVGIAAVMALMVVAAILVLRLPRTTLSF
ncbi:MFS transporter [Rhodococcoides kyotonense]|uniref:Drug resistance transporter, EmrB/QacA subfamily n=1 Tax=Rhodococcoides kyotonense TaxID=398843 RepID=A0A239MRQ9_9NOCA|nr:MFS transporter [Rhodococcus kyotonensis]SNT44953.1 drug resistance transporter, EmrB/QacA subfamily [Rhodococcus kyotonensis]